MWRKIRWYIWEQYYDQPDDAHSVAFKAMAREILTAAGACMTRLQYDRHITPLLLVSAQFVTWVLVDILPDVAFAISKRRDEQQRTDCS